MRLRTRAAGLLFLLLIGTLVAVAASRQAPAFTYARDAVADGYVRADLPNRSFGTARRLTLHSRPATRTYLRFRLTGRQRALERALLSVWTHNSTRTGFSVRLAANGWRERSLTFAHAPRTAHGRAIASGPVRRGWTNVDVTELVARARTSVTFVLATSGRATLALASREVPSRAPRLQITRAAPDGSVVLAGAGDIADDWAEDSQTAALIDAISPNVVFTLGDNAYEDGTAKQFARWYHPTWGRHKAKTRPAPGNHDYRTRNATGYFRYFGARAGDPTKGYYSYEAGDWHVVVLNTNGEGSCVAITCNGGSAQERWLRADLAASRKPCTLAYWHHPRYSIGPQGTSSGTQALWQALADDGAELVLTGHDHNYQRWKPMNAQGGVDPARGIRSFVVGTGGRATDRLGSHPNVDVARSGTAGVLKLTLRDGAYDWRFVPVAGKTFTDAGTGTCH